MSNDIFTQLIELRDCAASIASALNVPTAKSVVVKGDSKEFRITPDPIVTEVSQTEEQFDSIPSMSGQAKTFSVKGVSKKYSVTQLDRHELEYLIDGEIKCELKEIKENSLTWDLILVQKIGKQRWSNQRRSSR